jgi:CDP-diacylglycerol--serine O-phosphatidyltransferase
MGLENGINTILIPLIVLLSFLMVSTIPFDKIPSFDKKSIKKYKGRIFLFLFYLVLILLLQETGLMIVFSAFILKGLILGAVTFWREAFGENGNDENLSSEEYY